MAKKNKSKANAQKLAAKRQAKKTKRKSSKKNKSKKSTAKSNCSSKTKVTNPTFDNACSLLSTKNWYRYSGITDLRLVDGIVKIVLTEGLVFKSPNILVTLLPYKSGIQLSRLSVWSDNEKLQTASQFIDTLIAFLLNNDIKEIYCLPSEIGNDKESLDAVFTELQLVEIYSSKGFEKEANSSYWQLSNFTYWDLVEPINEEELVSDIFSKENYNPNFNVGEVEVYFDFIGNNSKNFVEVYEINNPEFLKNWIDGFINIAPEDNELFSMFKKCLSRIIVCNNSAELVELSNMVQNFMGVILAKDAKANDYQYRMKHWGRLLTYVLHLTNNGFEKNIIKYCFRFDERREIMDILFKNAPSVNSAA